VGNKAAHLVIGIDTDGIKPVLIACCELPEFV
jgi:hypothetical protein